MTILTTLLPIVWTIVFLLPGVVKGQCEVMTVLGKQENTACEAKEVEPQLARINANVYEEMLRRAGLVPADDGNVRHLVRDETDGDDEDRPNASEQEGENDLEEQEPDDKAYHNTNDEQQEPRELQTALLKQCKKCPNAAYWICNSICAGYRRRDRNLWDNNSRSSGYFGNKPQLQPPTGKLFPSSQGSSSGSSILETQYLRNQKQQVQQRQQRMQELRHQQDQQTLDLKKLLQQLQQERDEMDMLEEQVKELEQEEETEAVTQNPPAGDAFAQPATQAPPPEVTHTESKPIVESTATSGAPQDVTPIKPNYVSPDDFDWASIGMQLIENYWYIPTDVDSAMFSCLMATRTAVSDTCAQL
ncbi:hypothetical protein ACA910_008816 [Epithemia clementina (nom. ined.)]